MTIISTEKKFIFIHIPKTAGNAITLALQEYIDFDIERVSNRQGARQGLTVTTKDGQDIKHATIKDLYDMGIIDDKKFKDYFKFTVVRNPWDRLISVAAAKSYAAVEHKLTEYVENSELMLDYITTPDNEVHMDYVMKFEYLQEHFDNVCDLLKIPRRDLEVINRSRHDMYQVYYVTHPNLLPLVAKKCKVDIDVFGYEFEKDIKFHD